MPSKIIYYSAVALVAAFFIYGGIAHLVSARDRALDREHENAYFNYVDPQYPKGYAEWANLPDSATHKRWLREQYDFASEQEMDAAAGDTSDDLLRFHRRRMINWLERQLIERDEMLYRFQHQSQ